MIKAPPQRDQKQWSRHSSNGKRWNRANNNNTNLQWIGERNWDDSLKDKRCTAIMVEWMSSYLLNVNDNTKDRRCGASALRRTVALWLGLGDRVADDFRVTCGLFRFLLFFSLSLSLCVFCCFFFLTNSLLSSLHPFSLLHPPHPTPPSRIYYILYSSILCVYYIAGIVEKDGGSVSLSL